MLCFIALVRGENMHGMEGGVGRHDSLRLQVGTALIMDFHLKNRTLATKAKQTGLLILGWQNGGQRDGGGGRG